MSDLMNLDPFSWLMQLTVDELRECNDLTGRYGLLLSEEEMTGLARQRFDSLKNTDRIEFGGGVLKKLIEAFCDSPYLSQHSYADTLGELQESFYYFKNEALEQFSDDELIDMMKQFFDGVCQGSLEYLNGTTLEELCREARFGEAPDGNGRTF